MGFPRACVSALCTVMVIATGASSCGGSPKLTAPETANWLMQHQVAKRVHVVCRPGRGNWSEWDYACTVSGRGVPGSAAENTYGYDVDANGVTGFSG
jgi:hypothetical protein